MDTLRYSKESNVREGGHLLQFLEWTFRSLALLCLLYSVYLIAIKEELWVTLFGNVSSVTVGCVSAIILFSEYCFSYHQKMGVINSMVFSVLLAAAFVWSYELIYYLSFPGSWNFASITIISQLGSTLRTIATFGIYLLPMVPLRNKLTLRRTSVVLGAIFCGMWILWILYGFPQYYLANYLTSSIYPKTIVSSDPYRTSLVFNFGSKAVLGVFFISMLKFPFRDEIRAFAHRVALIRRRF